MEKPTVVNALYHLEKLQYQIDPNPGSSVPLLPLEKGTDLYGGKIILREGVSYTLIHSLFLLEHYIFAFKYGQSLPKKYFLFSLFFQTNSFWKGFSLNLSSLTPTVK